MLMQQTLKQKNYYFDIYKLQLDLTNTSSQRGIESQLSALIFLLDEKSFQLVYTIQDAQHRKRGESLVEMF